MQRTTKKNRRLHRRWFWSAFLISWMMIFFVIAFAWVASGGNSLNGEPIAAAGVTTDAKIHTADPSGGQPALYLEVMGYRGEIPLEQIANTVRIYKQVAVLVPAKYRLLVDLVGWAARSQS